MEAQFERRALVVMLIVSGFVYASVIVRMARALAATRWLEVTLCFLLLVAVVPLLFLSHEPSLDEESRDRV